MRPNANNAVVVDFETHMDAKNGYSLKKMSTRAYVTDERFDILSVAIALGVDSDVLFFHKYGTNGGSLDDARRLLEQAAAEGRRLVAHNVNFEGMILSLKWGIHFSRNFDTTSWLKYRGFGWSLANGARAVSLTKVDAPLFDNSSLLDIEKLQEFAYYNCMDVEIARALHHAAIGDCFFTDLEFWAVNITCRENIRGIAIDRAKAAELVRLFAGKRDASLTNLCTTFSNFDTAKLRSAVVVRAFMKSEFSVDLASLDKREPAVVALKLGDTDAGAGRFLRMREAVDTWDRQSKKAAILAAGPARVYGLLNYWGAHTGRWSGGGRDAERLNLQNLHKGGIDEFDDLKLIRLIVVADEDESFVSADLSTIEPRVLAFLAGQQDLIDLFAADADVYIYFISDVFPDVEIVKGKVNDHLRQLGKKGVLGLGYGQGKKAFLSKLRSEDPSITEDLAFKIHQQYHQKFQRISKLRRDYFNAFKQAADRGLASMVGGCSFRRIKDEGCSGFTVEVLLPTERLLVYRSVTRTKEVSPFGKLQWTYRYADDYQFEPADKKGGTRRSGTGKKKKCGDGQMRSQLLSQTLIENIVSAVARDVLVAQMQKIEEHEGIRIRFSVHDENVAATRRCPCSRRDEPREKGVPVEAIHEADCPWVRGRAIVKKMMSSVPDYFPKLVGLPVSCELSDAIRDSYGK